MTSALVIDDFAALFALPQVRYVALRSGDQVMMRQKDGLAGPSASESDRYEELLVNPTLLTLAGQRGRIDCGGLEYLLVGYGNFRQLVVPTRDGHVSVALENDGADAETVTAARGTIAGILGVDKRSD